MRRFDCAAAQGKGVHELLRACSSARQCLSSLHYRAADNGSHRSSLAGRSAGNSCNSRESRQPRPAATTCCAWQGTFDPPLLPGGFVIEWTVPSPASSPSPSPSCTAHGTRHVSLPSPLRPRRRVLVTGAPLEPCRQDPRARSPAEGATYFPRSVGACSSRSRECVLRRAPRRERLPSERWAGRFAEHYTQVFGAGWGGAKPPNEAAEIYPTPRAFGPPCPGTA